MEPVLVVLFVFFVGVISVAFIVLCHLNFKEALYHAMNSYDKSVHAHDDASARIADHHRMNNEHIKEMATYASAMGKTAKELTQFVLADINRGKPKEEPPQERDPNETQVTSTAGGNEMRG